MTNVIVNQNIRTGDYILTEANGQRSRDTVAYAPGEGRIQPGRLMGRLANGQFAPHDHAATDGREIACAVNYARVDLQAEPVAAVVSRRDCEVKLPCLFFATGADDAAKAVAVQQLADVGIIAR